MCKCKWRARRASRSRFSAPVPARAVTPAAAGGKGRWRWHTYLGCRATRQFLHRPSTGRLSHRDINDGRSFGCRMSATETAPYRPRRGGAAACGPARRRGSKWIIVPRGKEPRSLGSGPEIKAAPRRSRLVPIRPAVGPAPVRLRLRRILPERCARCNTHSEKGPRVTDPPAWSPPVTTAAITARATGARHYPKPYKTCRGRASADVKPGSAGTAGRTPLADGQGPLGHLDPQGTIAGAGRAGR